MLNLILGRIWEWMFTAISWEVWLAVGLAASVGAYLLIAQPFGRWVGTALLVITLSLTGYSRGVAWEKALWEARLEEQRRQYEARIATIQREEAERQSAARKEVDTARKELDDALAKIPKGRELDRVAAPEPVAGWLHSRAKPSSVPARSRGGSPGKIRRMFRSSGAPANP